MSSSTKIINVLKDDSFAEILNIFKTTPAGEVIFVLPKRSKAFQREEHFSVLREAADEVNKTVSFLSSNPEVNILADKHGFDVLLARQTSVKQKLGERTARSAKKTAIRSAPVNMVNEIENFYGQVPSELIEQGEQYNIKVSSVKEKGFSVPVNRQYETAENDDEGIEQVWSETAEPVAEWKSKVGKLSIRRWGAVMPRKRRLIYTFGGGGVVLAGALIYLTTGSAQVLIKPAVTDLNFKITATASESVASVDTAGLKLPGQTFVIQKSVSQTFNATGSKDVAQKARGSITLYNKTSAAQPLIATTRFQSSDGHIFRSLLTVTVPAAKNTSTPGTTEVQVIADKIGSDYNVPAGDFTIPAFKEQGNTAKYQNITGASKSAMRGGTSGKATVVTADDFEKAKDLLTVQLRQLINDETKVQTAGLKIINEADISIAPPESTALPDDAADTFTMSLDGTLKTAGFKEEDLMGLIKQYVDKTKNLTAIPEKLTISYTDVVFDEVNNTLTFTVNIKGNGYAKIDIEKIKIDLMGKKENEIRNYLKAVPGVESAKVVLSPFWVKKIPQDKDKIKIQINY